MSFFLEDEIIGLRALVADDINETYLSWLNSQHVSEQNSHAYFPYTMHQLNDFYKSIIANKQLLLLAIIYKQTNVHIGNISLQNIQWINRSAEFAIMMGDSGFWGKGLSYRAANLIVLHGFRHLNLHRIYCGTTSENIAMQKLALKLKMKQEGVRREAFFKHDTYQDIIEYGVLKNEFLND